MTTTNLVGFSNRLVVKDSKMNAERMAGNASRVARTFALMNPASHALFRGDVV